MLKSDAGLERSDVVANSTMNRERGLRGANSYIRDLGIDPLEELVGRLGSGEGVRWLDLCCGRGRALLQCAAELVERGLSQRVELLGVDLVSAFERTPSEEEPVRFLVASLHEWEPRGDFDLITCVHGLHYLGDKLGLLARAAGWLRPGGLLVAHLDPANLVLAEGEGGSRVFLRALREQGFEVTPRSGRIRRVGPASVRFPFEYLGADDAAGPNRTGQPAVNSHYRRSE